MNCVSWKLTMLQGVCPIWRCTSSPLSIRSILHAPEGENALPNFKVIWLVSRDKARVHEGCDKQEG